ncbi:MAG TPA: preprotein translocase subunit SecE [Candidatus Magasanikbacteria bacterium]|nr:preprotein translocase subunit SecE [Candidatus Magasanikbacteria bacterium]
MSIGTKIVNYFQTSKVELKKVTWPTKKETTRYTLIVVGLCLVVALFFALLDGVFNLGLEKLISLK